MQHTLHSELKRTKNNWLKYLEKIGVSRIKLVERTGDKLVDLLHKSDAWGDKDCGRSDCFPYNSSGEKEPKGSCKRRSILYETYCEDCSTRNCKKWGEKKKMREKRINR